MVGAGLRVRGCAGLRVLGCVIRLVWGCGCAGFGQRYLAGVVVRVRGVRATLSGSRLRYPAGVGVRVRGVRATLSGWCGCAGARGSGNVIWMVWLISWLVGAGVRESEGSKLRYLVGVVFRCACWLVLCGWA